MVLMAMLLPALSLPAQIRRESACGVRDVHFYNGFKLHLQAPLCVTRWPGPDYAMYEFAERSNGSPFLNSYVGFAADFPYTASPHGQLLARMPTGRALQCGELRITETQHGLTDHVGGTRQLSTGRCGEILVRNHAEGGMISSAAIHFRYAGLSAPEEGRALEIINAVEPADTLPADPPLAPANVWQPSPGHTQIPLWPGSVPDARSLPEPESVISITKQPVGGRPWLWVTSVTKPTMTVYPPKGTNTGVAVVVFPGGGFSGLAIDLEGSEICDWLASRGITAVLLKYRVPDSGPHGLRPPAAPTALQDAQRTMGLLRLHAAEWKIDPHKIGVIGFSAGGYLVAALSTHFEKRLYPVVDAADRESCRPDFAIALYPGHLCASDKTLKLNPAVPVSAKVPPTFLAQAEDDTVDGVHQALAYYVALKNAGVPVEMHLFAHGGHAFGLRETKFPITRWPRLVEQWLTTIGMTRAATRDR